VHRQAGRGDFAGPLNQGRIGRGVTATASAKGVTTMSNDVTKKETWPRDNFGWEPDIPSGDDKSDRPARSMQGEAKLSYVAPNWSVDGIICNGRELVCYDKTFSVIRWKDDSSGPLEVIPVKRGEKPPDLKEKNAKIPQSEWRIAFGKPEAPYQLQRCLEFLDPLNMERLSWPHNVTVAGSSRAAEELEGRIKIARRVSGENVYPLVKLEHRHMPTNYGGRERPHLAIVKWARLGEHGIEYVDLSTAPAQAQLERFAQAGPAKPQQSALPMQSVPEVTVAEEIDDKLPY
jgi:hypothetical protein